jgi:hypothetical protein
MHSYVAALWAHPLLEVLAQKFDALGEGHEVEDLRLAALRRAKSGLTAARRAFGNRDRSVFLWASDGGPARRNAAGCNASVAFRFVSSVATRTRSLSGGVVATIGKLAQRRGCLRKPRPIDPSIAVGPGGSGC